ncbi:hypothetical protein RRG08_019223 [Elysia crispata]|uniref:Uncharacterized protein n=1 Tax=Elysia crispata TaxID=231223 RepID=A0AAE1E4V4_9GAST|nr:hypothetical protein RRG08_019223 [Elysia crispata]
MLSESLCNVISEGLSNVVRIPVYVISEGLSNVVRIPVYVISEGLSNVVRIPVYVISEGLSNVVRIPVYVISEGLSNVVRIPVYVTRARTNPRLMDNLRGLAGPDGKWFRVPFVPWCQLRKWPGVQHYLAAWWQELSQGQLLGDLMLQDCSSSEAPRDGLNLIKTNQL